MNSNHKLSTIIVIKPDFYIKKDKLTEKVPNTSTTCVFMTGILFIECIDTLYNIAYLTTTLWETLEKYYLSLME